MKRFWLLPLMSVALLLAACADGGAAQTPGALGTEPGLGTDTGLATQPGLGTDTGMETAAVTEAVEPTMAATTEATMAATTEATAAATSDAAETPVGQATAETDVQTGIVAAPFDLFSVASVTGQIDTGTGGTGTGAATPAAGTEQPAGTQPATTGTQPAGMETDQNRLLVRASELLGSDIVSSNGEMVGTVSEVLVDPAGEVQYVVFDANEFLNAEGGTGGTGGDTGGTGATTPEPLGTLDNSTQVVGTIEPAGTAAAGTPEGVATSTVGDATAIANPGAVADENTILVFEGAAAELETMGVMLPEGLLDGGGTTIDTSGGDMPANMSELNGLVRMTQVTDGNANVLDAQQQDMGEVEDLLVDIRQGMVAYGVVDFGGFLGIAENTVAVPWQQFSFSTAAGTDADLMLEVNQDTLQNAPQLDMSNWQAWPNQIPTDWETETRTFWETAS